MPVPEHRRTAGRRAPARLLLVAAFLLGALLTTVVAGVLASTSSTRTSTSGGSTSNGNPTDASGTPSPTAPAIPIGKAVQRALTIKPLTQLQPGDRVVYNMTPCRFRNWVGTGIDVALIACPDEQEPFQTRTENLIPVEPSTGD